MIIMKNFLLLSAFIVSSVQIIFAQLPEVRYGHTLTKVNDQAYLFGGKSETGTGGSYLHNDLWRFDGQQDSWQNLQPANAPEKRYGHSAVENNGKLYIMNGIGANNKILNDVWVYDAGKGTWVKEQSIDAPSGRYNHAAIVYQDLIYVMGGVTNEGISNEVYSWDINTKKWKKEGELNDYIANGKAIVNEDMIYVIGGDDMVSIINTFDPASNTTGTVFTMGTTLPVLKNPSVVQVGKKALVFGGSKKGQFQPTCPGSVSDADQNSYQTTMIGDQCWMAENLRTKSPNSVCLNFDCASNEIQFGRYYSWQDVMKGKDSSSSIPSGVQGICPTGWHIPSQKEFIRLADAVNATNGNANDLKATTGWYFGGGTNNTGFNAHPGGTYSSSSSTFSNYLNNATFFSTTIYPSSPYQEIESFVLEDGKNTYYFATSHQTDWGNVRCVKDQLDDVDTRSGSPEYNSVYEIDLKTYHVNQLKNMDVARTFAAAVSIGINDPDSFLIFGGIGEDISKEKPYEIFYAGTSSVIRGNPEDFSVNCFPNPFSDRLEIKIQVDEPLRIDIEISDLVGKQIHQISDLEIENVFQYSWYVNNGQMHELPAGGYIIKINSGKHTKSIRVVKM